MVSRVAVIGAGPSGLGSLRYLMSYPSEIEVVCFEKNSKVGGMWIYTDDTGVDKNGLPIHSSLYKNLRTNLTKDLMSFPDHNYKSTLKSFLHHEDVLEYIESYASKFNLHGHIKFQTIVENVRPMTKEEDTIWEVSYRNVERNSPTHTEFFNAVMVCNGHYTVPRIPHIPGEDRFKGKIIHSHAYRKPEPFRGQTVVCLGAGASGEDIAIDIVDVAKTVFLSHRMPRKATIYPDNVIQKPGIKHLEEYRVIFDDDESVSVDAILLGTGYYYDFPFLSNDCMLIVDDGHVSPLYKHVLHIDFPSLSFINLLNKNCPFIQIYYQVQYVLALIRGKFKLPSKETMRQETETEFQRKLEEGNPLRHAHHVMKEQWTYCNELASIAGVKPCSKVLENICTDISNKRFSNVVEYRRFMYEITSSESFKTTFE